MPAEVVDEVVEGGPGSSSEHSPLFILTTLASNAVTSLSLQLGQPFVRIGLRYFHRRQFLLQHARLYTRSFIVLP